MRLVDLSAYSPLLPIAIFFIFLKRNREKRLWVIPLYLFWALGNDHLVIFLRQHDLLRERFYAYTVFSMVEGTIFLYYTYAFIKSSSIKYAIIAIFASLCVVSIITSINSKDPFNDNLAAAEEISIIIVSLVFLYEQVNDPKVTFIYGSKEFWIICSFFLYSAATLFLFITLSFLTQEMRNNSWLINQVANIFKNLLFIVAFVKQPQTIKHSRTGMTYF